MFDKLVKTGIAGLSLSKSAMPHYSRNLARGTS